MRQDEHRDGVFPATHVQEAVLEDDRPGLDESGVLFVRGRVGGEDGEVEEEVGDRVEGCSFLLFGVAVIVIVRIMVTAKVSCDQVPECHELWVVLLERRFKFVPIVVVESGE